MRGDLEWGTWGTIPNLVRDAAERYARREAVVDGRTRVTYAELGERVERAAAACIAMWRGAWPHARSAASAVCTSGADGLIR